MKSVSYRQIFFYIDKKSSVLISYHIIFRLSIVLKNVDLYEKGRIFTALLVFKGRPLLQGVPLSKTVHRTVFEIHPCGALRNCGALPHTPQGLSALDLTKGSILPLESHSYCAVSDFLIGMLLLFDIYHKFHFRGLLDTPHMNASAQCLCGLMNNVQSYAAAAFVGGI